MPANKNNKNKGQGQGKPRTNLKVVAPTDVADEGDPYANPKEHRLFTPKKMYNFGKLNPSGVSEHPESIKRRTIVGKKSGIEAAKFTIRETARSRRRHRKDALRKTQKYKEMSMAEQQRALLKIDDTIQREIAASDREAEQAWALYRGEASPQGDGHSSPDLAIEQTRAHQILLEEQATAARKLGKKPGRKPKAQTKEFITPKEEPQTSNQPQQQTRQRARKTHSTTKDSKMAGSKTATPKPQRKITKKFSPKDIFKMIKETEADAANRHAFLKSELEKTQEYRSLTSKYKKIKLREIEEQIEREVQDILAEMYTNALDQSSVPESVKNAYAAQQQRAAEVTPAPANRNSGQPATPSIGMNQQISAKRRIIDTDLPEKTRLHNRSKSSPKKRRLAPIDFEAIEKVNKISTGESTPSSSEPSGDSNPARRLTRSRATGDAPTNAGPTASATVPAAAPAADTKAAGNKRKAPPLAEESENPVSSRFQGRRLQTNGPDDSASDDLEQPLAEQAATVKRVTRATRAQVKTDANSLPESSAVAATEAPKRSNKRRKVLSAADEKAMVNRVRTYEPVDENDHNLQEEQEEGSEEQQGGVWETVIKKYLPWNWGPNN